MEAIRRYAVLPLLLLPVAVVLIVLLAWPRQANAQCGSSASSCKNCHEVQGEYPVNASGDWHVSHAFGDFCEFCHAGNVQATEIEAAHAGMVYPLEDADASCLSCHPDDMAQKAELYATALGVTVGTGGRGAPSGGESSETEPSQDEAPAAGVAEPADDTEDLAEASEGSIVDYNSQYERTALNERPAINVGNAILSVMLVGLTALGGGLAWKWEGLDERWRALRGMKVVAATGVGASTLLGVPVVERQTFTNPLTEERPPAPEITALLQKLDEPTLRALQMVLADLEVGSLMIQALRRLDPRLVQAVARLDVEERALLMAVVGTMESGDVGTRE